MRGTSSKRLAGCIAIELALAAGLTAANYEYRAAVAVAGGVEALALEDRQGARALIAQADFPVSLQLSDLVAAQAMKAYGLARGAILLRGTGSGTPRADDFTSAISEAFRALAPAEIRYSGDTLYLDAGRGCVAVRIAAPSPPACPERARRGSIVRAPIRSVFQTVDLTPGLRSRTQTLRLYPVQAIALGKGLTILGVGGNPPAGAFRSPGVLVAPFASDDEPFPEDARVPETVRLVLERVRK